MSDPARRRRPRAVFHYKVDETLTAEHREAYLALLRDPRTRIDDARGWLLARGYAISRSAVARHRRRLLAAERSQQVALDRALARLAGSPDAPDFAAGAAIQLQHLVFQRLMNFDEPSMADHAREHDDGDDDGRDNAAAPDPPEPPPIDAAELLRLTKLVALCVDLTRRLQQAGRIAPGQQTPAPTPQPPGGSPPAPPPPPTDAELRKNFEDILFGRK